MPNKSDDTPEFRAKQKEHAQKIRTERVIMNMTGMNRSQVRRLQSFATQIQAQKAAQAAVQVQRPEPTVNRAETTIGGRQLNPVQQVAQALRPDVSARMSFNVISNGTRSLADVDATNLRDVDA